MEHLSKIDLITIDDGALLSDQEIGATLSITTQTLWRWRKAGIFPQRDVVIANTKRTSARLVKQAAGLTGKGE